MSMTCPKCGSGASLPVGFGAKESVRKCYTCQAIYVRPTLVQCPVTQLWTTAR